MPQSELNKTFFVDQALF